MTGERLSDEQYDELLTVVYGSNIRSELAGAVLNLIREHRQLMAERAETAREKLRADRADEALVYLEQKVKHAAAVTARLRAALEAIRDVPSASGISVVLSEQARAALVESEG
jgi:hypothetical protein